MTELRIRPAAPADAAAVHGLTRAAFSGYDDLEPPSGALRESAEDIAAELAANGGLVAESADGLVGVARFSRHDGRLWLRRLAVDPTAQGRGIGTALVQAATAEAARRGEDTLRVGVRTPLSANRAWFAGLGFVELADHGFWVELARPVPVSLPVPTAERMRELGLRLAGLLRPGDLVVLNGDLGAGKTTLTQGIGAGLGVRGEVTSPTFVIARVHPAPGGGPALVHVDAYRLGSLAEVDDLDLDASLEDSVTVVEWGSGKVEGLAEDRLDVVLRRAHGDEEGELREVLLRPVGQRWVDVRLPRLD